jgi:DNA-binding beta-propeller fold protein YncE
MRVTLLTLTLAGLLPGAALAHPGSGIVVDRLGQVYFVDMVSGIWKLDPRGTLTHLPGSAFHWMTLDAEGRFASVRLPAGPGWDFDRIGSNPTLLLASDFPLAIGRDGILYFPSQGETPVKLRTFSPSGQLSVLATLPATTPHGPLRWINGLTAAPDGSLYYSEDDAIRRVSREGRVSTVAEHVKPTGCAAHDPLLRGLDVDAGGNVYVADAGCGTVLKLTPAGVVTILPQVQQPWFPTGLALSGEDLYVLEFQNPDTDDRHAMLPRIRKIAADGTTSVVATVTRH